MDLATEHLLVALAAGDFGDLLDMVTSHNNVLRAAEQAAADEAAALYSRAVVEWLDYLGPIIENNPGKTFAQIAARPDVQLALVQALNEASETVRDTVIGGWVVGQELGIAHILLELEALGLDLPDLGIGVANSYLSTLLDGLDTATVGAMGRILAAAQEGFDIPDLDIKDAATLNVRKRLARQRLRETATHARFEAGKLSTSASRAASVAVNRGYAEKQREAYAAASVVSGVVIRKVWVTNFSPTTCGACAALHGTVVEIVEVFDGLRTFDRPLGVYQDLLTPPRHPHCRCRIMPFVVERTVAQVLEREVEPSPISPSTMRDFAVQWWLAQHDVLPDTPTEAGTAQP